jgi:prolyl-tRNA synthetase
VLAVDDEEGKEKQIWLLLLRGDHELNEVKVSKVAGLANYRFATEAEIVEWFGTSRATSVRSVLKTCQRGG